MRGILPVECLGCSLLMMPVTRYIGLLWGTLEKLRYKATMGGAPKQRGMTWSKIFDTAP